MIFVFRETLSAFDTQALRPGPVLRARRRPATEKFLALLLPLLFVGCGLIESEETVPSAGHTLYEGSPSPEESYDFQIVDRWTLGWTADARPTLEELKWSGVRGREITLAITGSLPSKELAREDSRKLADSFERTIFDLENQGVSIRGLHLHLADEEARPFGFPEPNHDDVLARRAALKSLVRGINRRLEAGLELSVFMDELDASQLQEEIANVAPAVDWVVLDLYGQAPTDADDPRLWDLEGALNRLRAARSEGVRSRGLVNVSGAVRLTSGENSTNLGSFVPCSLFWDLVERSDSVFQFEGYFRQVFQADPRSRSLRVGDTEIPSGNDLLVTRVTPSHLRKLELEANNLADPLFLGFVYSGVERTRGSETAEANCVGIDLPTLRAAHQSVARYPSLILQRSGNRATVKLVGGSEPTVLGRKRYNFVDVMTAGGGVISGVEVDGFVRYEFLSGNGEPAAGIRGRGVRLFVPLLGPDRVAVANFSVQSTSELTAEAIFRTPTGEPIPVESAQWPPVVPGRETDEVAGQ